MIKELCLADMPFPLVGVSVCFTADILGLTGSSAVSYVWPSWLISITPEVWYSLLETINISLWEAMELGFANSSNSSHTFPLEVILCIFYLFKLTFPPVRLVWTCISDCYCPTLNAGLATSPCILWDKKFSKIKNRDICPQYIEDMWFPVSVQFPTAVPYISEPDHIFKKNFNTFLGTILT